jgi:hypothetical protein
MKYHKDSFLALAKCLEITPKQLSKMLVRSHSLTSFVEKLIKEQEDDDEFIGAYQKLNATELSNWIDSQNFRPLKPEHEIVFEQNAQCAYIYAALILKKRFREEIEQKVLFSSMWLSEYFHRFFEKDLKLPEYHHNFMILQAAENDQYAKNYLKISQERTEDHQDKNNVLLIHKALGEFLSNNEITKDIPKDQLHRAINKIF